MGTVSQGEVTFTARTAGAAQTALNFTESSLVTIPLVSNSLILTQSSLFVTLFVTTPPSVTATPAIAARDISGAVTLASTTGMAPATGTEYATVSAIGMEYESKGAVLPLVSFTVTAFAGAMEQGDMEYNGASQVTMVEGKDAVWTPASVTAAACAIGMEYDDIPEVTMVEGEGAVLPPTSVTVTASAVGMEYDGAS